MLFCSVAMCDRLESLSLNMVTVIRKGQLSRLLREAPRMVSGVLKPLWRLLGIISQWSIAKHAEELRGRRKVYSRTPSRVLTCCSRVTLELRGTQCSDYPRYNGPAELSHVCATYQVLAQMVWRNIPKYSTPMSSMNTYVEDTKELLGRFSPLVRSQTYPLM